ncbi:HAD hydrolase family protein [Nitrosopumilus sp.]|nr:HAD hydrolase family protein [Nitrosopumilus sp.]
MTYYLYLEDLIIINGVSLDIALTSDLLFKKIKIVLTDVDGVLTDGGMYYSVDGDVMKKFHARDGMGISLLRKNNIPTVIVTKEKTKMVKHWAKKMNAKLFDGVLHKEEILKKICTKYDVSPSEIAYIGDDVNDIELLKLVGLGVVPKDGNQITKKSSNYISKTIGGKGVFREIAELILLSKKIPIKY